MASPPRMETQHTQLTESASPQAPFFPVVGIGASAGGFAALETLLQNMPPRPGMALVVILHLAADQPSAAARILQAATAMPVVQVGHTIPVLPNQVYVIPPGRSLGMRGGCLVLDALERGTAGPVAVDLFFRALAQAHAQYAVGVVLSGMGTDGTAGLARIKEMGGVTIAQLPRDAEHGSMPRSAIESGMADFVLAANEIPGKLAELRDIADTIRRRARDGNMADAPVPIEMGPRPDETLAAILALLCERTGHDFRHYKRPTLLRRLERRLQVRALPSLPAYLDLLRKDTGEARALLKDLLIGVTSFLRDPAVFEALQRRVVPALFERQAPGRPLRVWVAACSSGEEAYSIAMLLADAAQARDTRPKLQVFASDIDEHALALARAGVYPDTIADSVPPDQLQRHFTQEGKRCKVRKALRDQVLFTQHNLLHDAAFSRLDLISCRNFLIYLNREMHRQLLEQFHFALNPGGYLLLGGAESVEAAPDLFAPVDAAHRIYRALPAATTARLPEAALAGARPASAAACVPADVPAAPPPGRRGRLFSFAEIHLHKAAGLAPPSILVNDDGDILHVSEAAARFLRQNGGEPTRDIVALLLPELRLALRVALFQARQAGAPAASGPVRYGQDGAEQVVDMRVLPFQDEHAEGSLLLVCFHAAADMPAQADAAPAHERALLDQLGEELRQVRERLQETVEQAEVSNNALQTGNEEMQTMVAELRAGAEELQRSLDEARSSSQELRAVNRELQRRAEEMAKAHDDLSNLIASSGVATIFLDRAMRILRYTPRIADFFNVIPADVGRPLPHITNRLDYPQLAQEASRVFETLQPMEREVRGRDGRHYIVRVHPYRTIEDRIDGAVMSFFDISSRRAAEDALRASEEQFRLFVTASSDMLYKMSADWGEMRSLIGKNALASTDAPKRDWFDAYIPPAAQGQVRAAIEDAIASKAPFELEHQVFLADGGIGWTFSRAVPMLDAAGGIVEWFGANSDITPRRRADEALRESETRLLAVFESLPAGAAVIDTGGRVVLANHEMQRYLPSGLIPSRDAGRQARWRSWHPDGSIVDPDDYPGSRALRGERLVPGIEMLYREDSGREIWTQVASGPIRDDAGRITGQVAIITDIDAQKRTEAVLRENEARLLALVDALGPGTPGGAFPEAWLDEGWTDAVHPDEREAVLCAWQAGIAQRRMVDLVFRLRSADGGWRRTRVRAAPLFDVDGTLRTWAGIATPAQD